MPKFPILLFKEKLLKNTNLFGAVQSILFPCVRPKGQFSSVPSSDTNRPNIACSMRMWVSPKNYI